jgi:Ca-activated chloride channel family protein
MMASGLTSLAVAVPPLSRLLDGAQTLTFKVAQKQIVVERPAALLLLLVLPLLLPALFSSLTDMSRRQLILQFAMRTLLLVCLSAALAQPSILGERSKTSLVAMVDVSDSMSDAQLELAHLRVDELRRLAKSRGDELHVLTFASRPRLLPLPPPEKPLPALRSVQGGKDDGDKSLGRHASNLQGALQLSYGLHPPDTVRRAVILSDGNQTEGDVLAEALSASRRHVRVGYFPVAAEPIPEVLVRELRLIGGAGDGGQLKVGAPFSLEAEIYSSVPQRARVTLYQGERENPEDGRRDVELLAGRNILRFRSQADTPGYLDYRVQVTAVPEKPLADRFVANNHALLPLFARGKPRVLYIEGEPSAKAFLSQALERESIEVETRNPYGLPHSAKELLAYDLLLMSDVSATLVSQGQMVAIESYVRDHGGGFVMTGGENSFGSGGYQGTQLEKLLPVRFEQEKKRDQPSLALVLAIDRSGSMNGPKLELAKDAARGTAEMLAADDLIGVVAFDSQATPLVRLQRAQNRVRISADIARLTAGGGTQLLPPLQEAYQQLAAATAKIKHVILLTDGQAEYSGIIDLVNQMVAQKITVSTVGVGSGADQTLLTAIAENGAGRFYFTQDASSIPKIFTKETTQVARSALIEERVRPVVSKFVELLDGVGIESAPALRGYVSTKAKPLAEVILTSPQGEPLLARWRQGLGQVAAFTSDVKNRWAVDWLRWPGYARFWAQLVRSTMRHDGRHRGPGYELSAVATPPYVHVRVDAVASDDRFVSGLDSQIEVIENTLGMPLSPGASPGAQGRSRPILTAPLPQTAPGRYEADLFLPRTGAFLLRAVHRSGKTGTGAIVAESWGALSLSYPREYLALPPDLGLLARVAEVTGGGRYDSAAAALDAGDEKTRFLRALWPYLVGAALILLVLDVLLRRVRIFGYRPLSL